MYFFAFLHIFKNDLQQMEKLKYLKTLLYISYKNLYIMLYLTNVLMSDGVLICQKYLFGPWTIPSNGFLVSTRTVIVPPTQLAFNDGWKLSLKPPSVS